jgi:hypothetical protein
VALRPRLLDWPASSTYSNPIRWRPRADPGQKREFGDWVAQEGLTSRGPLQKSRPVTEEPILQIKVLRSDAVASRFALVSHDRERLSILPVLLLTALLPTLIALICLALLPALCPPGRAPRATLV